jgi:hypothetical protein
LNAEPRRARGHHAGGQHRFHPACNRGLRLNNSMRSHGIFHKHSRGSRSLNSLSGKLSFGDTFHNLGFHLGSTSVMTHAGWFTLPKHSRLTPSDENHPWFAPAPAPRPGPASPPGPPPPEPAPRGDPVAADGRVLTAPLLSRCWRIRQYHCPNSRITSHMKMSKSCAAISRR